jgi:hypothetical protein
LGIRPDSIAPRTINGIAAGQDTQLLNALRFLRNRLARSARRL